MRQTLYLTIDNSQMSADIQWTGKLEIYRSIEGALVFETKSGVMIYHNSLPVKENIECFK